MLVGTPLLVGTPTLLHETHSDVLTGTEPTHHGPITLKLGLQCHHDAPHWDLK